MGVQVSGNTSIVDEEVNITMASFDGFHYGQETDPVSNVARQGDYLSVFLIQTSLATNSEEKGGFY